MIVIVFTVRKGIIIQMQKQKNRRNETPKTMKTTFLVRLTHMIFEGEGLGGKVEWFYCTMLWRLYIFQIYE